jgi:hypothetical protein
MNDFDYFDRFFEEEILKDALKYPLPVSHNMDAPLPYTCYSNQRLKPGEAYVIFGCEKEGLNWVYSDRIWEWDRIKAEKANEAAKASEAKLNTPRYYQEFLRAFYDKPSLELICIMGGYNAATLYTFYCYGFRGIEKSSK